MKKYKVGWELKYNYTLLIYEAAEMIDNYELYFTLNSNTNCYKLVSAMN